MTFVVRLVPEVEPHTEVFWTSGTHDRLVVPACRACGHLLLPPAPVCNRCRSTDLEQRELSGLGTVLTWTANQQAWFPDMSVPNVLAVLQLDEEPGLRLLVTVDGVETVSIGDRVAVRFAVSGDVAVPYGELA